MALYLCLAVLLGGPSLFLTGATRKRGASMV